jgi:hypothetical protein
MKYVSKKKIDEEKDKTNSIQDHLDGVKRMDKMSVGGYEITYQVFKRNNDKNGNPYRLIFIYNSTGKIIKAYESRCSSPNLLNQLYESDQHHELPIISVAPAEYNRLKRKANQTGHCSVEHAS